MQRDEKRQKTTKPINLSYESLELHMGSGSNSDMTELSMVANLLLLDEYVGRLIPPGHYKLTDEIEVMMQCYVSVRRDDYGVIKIDFISAISRLGDGGVSFVAPYITCMKSVDGRLILKGKALSRVAKVTDNIIETRGKGVTQVAAAMNEHSKRIKDRVRDEVSNLRQLNLFNVRGPYYGEYDEPDFRICSILTMQRAQGVDLFTALTSGRKRSIKLLLEIQLQCMYQLQSQFHDPDYIHNDIKPENIMLDESGYIPRVAYVDCEFVRSRHDGRYTRMMGTPDYMAPEMVRECKFSYASDIYQLGLVLRILWGDSGFDEIHLIKNPRDVFRERERRGWEKVSNFKVRSVEEIEPEQYQKIQALLMRMTAYDAANRCDLDDCIEQTEAIYQQHLMRNVSEETENIRQLNTGDVSTLFAEKSRKYIAKKVIADERIKRLKKKLKSNLAGLPHDSVSVAAFCLRQNEICLQGLSTFAELHNKIDEVLDNFLHACKQWDELLPVFADKPNADVLLRQHAIFKQKIMNTTLNLDSLVKQTAHVHRKISKMQVAMPAAEVQNRLV